MKTRNLIIAVMLLSGLAFTSCQKDNAFQAEADDMVLKSHETGQIWSVQEDPLTNYPDPFVTTTTIKYVVKEAGRVRLTVSGENGHGIAILVSDFQEAGVYRVEFDGTNLQPGKYVAILSLNNVGMREEMIKAESLTTGEEDFTD